MQSPGVAGSLLAGSGPQPRPHAERAWGEGSLARRSTRPRLATPCTSGPAGRDSGSPPSPLSPRSPCCHCPGWGWGGGEYGGGAHPSRPAVSPAHPELCLHTCPRDRLGLHTSLSTRDFCPFPPPPPGLSPRPCLCLPGSRLVVWSVTQGSPSLAPCLLLPPLCSLSPHLSLNPNLPISGSSRPTPYVGPSLVPPAPHTHAPSLLGWR